jgi:hypothetical protein
MDKFLIPGGLYKIYYRSGKKDKGPIPSYRALILLVNFSNRRIYRYQDLQKEKFDKKRFTYEAVEMRKNFSAEGFSIVPVDIAKAVLLKKMKDLRDWPLEAVRIYFTRQGVSRDHIDELYNRDSLLKNIDFSRFHVRAALRMRRKQEKLKKRKTKAANDIWIEAEYAGLDEMGYLIFNLSVADLEDIRYRFGPDTDIVSVAYQASNHIIKCFNDNGDIVHRMNPPWPPEVAREAFERQRNRSRAEEGSWNSAIYHGTTWASTTNST